MNIDVQYATQAHIQYAQEVCDLIASAAKARGTGIAKREPKYIRQKIENDRRSLPSRALSWQAFAT